MDIEIPTYPRRVKVYFLEDDQWVDMGTGYCTGEIIEEDETSNARLTVRNEKDSDDIILRATVSAGIQFQKQQETLIVWTEPAQQTDVALSFQEAEGCAGLCDFLVHIQQTVERTISILYVMRNEDGTETTEIIAGPLVQPPNMSLGNLDAVLECVSPLGPNKFNNEALARHLLNRNYLDQLPDIFAMAEDLESLEDLHYLSQIVKVLFLMGDAGIWDALLQDSIFEAAIGALEYDPEVDLRQKANYRSYLRQFDNFRQVIPLPSEGLQIKVRQAFRLEFARDVVLSRILDENVQGIMNSVLFFHQSEIVAALQTSGSFLSSLFNLYREDIDHDQDQETLHLQREDGVRLVREIWNMVKTFPLQQRATLYSALVKNGLFVMLRYGLGSSSSASMSTKRAATELVSGLLDFDAKIVRQGGDDAAVIGVLTDLLLNDSNRDYGLKVLASEALRILLEPPSELMPSLAGPNGSQRSLQDSRGSTIGQIGSLDMHMFVLSFYENHAKQLFGPLIRFSSESNLEGNTDITHDHEDDTVIEILTDLLAFCIHHHGVRCEAFFEENGLAWSISHLIRFNRKAIRLAAIRCIKEAVLLSDSAILGLLIESRAIASLVSVMVSLEGRNNLATSACIEVLYLIAGKTTFLNSSPTRPCVQILNYLVDDYGIENVKSKISLPVIDAVICAKEEAQQSSQKPSEENGDTKHIKTPPPRVLEAKTSAKRQLEGGLYDNVSERSRKRRASDEGMGTASPLQGDNSSHHMSVEEGLNDLNGEESQSGHDGDSDTESDSSGDMGEGTNEDGVKKSSSSSASSSSSSSSSSLSLRTFTNAGKKLSIKFRKKKHTSDRQSKPKDD
uniref:ARAD1D04532p n=1 Tax=Blastobotrys adeninivorans TaxID=409370 RepID=A0A060T8L9_BLAAD